jgi:hypothetical protein
MRKLHIAVFVAFLVLLAGCTSQQASPQPAAVPAHLTNCDYSGSWNTDWGTMQLTQTGNEVSGNYTYKSGRVSGTVTDGVMSGKWYQSPSFSEPQDAGDLMFYFTTDCNAFSGDWRYGTGTAGSAWNGTWFGTKNS